MGAEVEGESEAEEGAMVVPEPEESESDMVDASGRESEMS